MKIFTKNMVAAVVAASVLAGGAMTMTSAQANPAMMCKALKSGTGNSLAKFTAKAKARQAWKVNVTGAYGPAWAKFSNAKVAAFPCNKAQGQWFCNVRAKPCKGLDLKTR